MSDQEESVPAKIRRTYPGQITQVAGYQPTERATRHLGGQGRIIGRPHNTRKAAMLSSQQEQQNNNPEVSYAT